MLFLLADGGSLPQLLIQAAHFCRQRGAYHCARAGAGVGDRGQVGQRGRKDGRGEGRKWYDAYACKRGNIMVSGEYEVCQRGISSDGGNDCQRVWKAGTRIATELRTHPARFSVTAEAATPMTR